MKYKLKQIWRDIKVYASLPHLWILGIVLVLSIIACTISVACMESNVFLSSVFANIFAGLVTGVVISLISTIKSITLYRTECLIEWLDSLHKDILECIAKWFLEVRTILLMMKHYIIIFTTHYVVGII